MYLAIAQGSVINIQGLECHLPPEGYIYNHFTKEMEHVGIYERSKIPEEQYWERFPLPPWYKDVTKREDDYLKKKKEDDPPFYDEKYESYKRQEWGRRINGFWLKIYNPKTKQSESVYLTGFYYTLLQWFNIDIGFAKFIMPHLYKTYFLEYCIQDPKCMGMIDVTKRRFLKTFIGGLFLLEYVTRTKMVNGAIQSKTGNDAKKVFGKSVVYPFRKFPRFFRPEYDMSLGINPKTEIRFQQTNIRGKKAEDGIDKDELGSMIDWGSADPIHFDGQKIHRYFSDEWGKTTEANIYDRHEVIRYCLLDEEGRIIGKALYSTTVEKLESDKDGVQQAAKELWDASNQNNRQANGMTQSGLYRFFQTSDEGRNFDKYGYPDVELTIKEILEDRETVKNNPRSLTARMHKEPRTIEEAFSFDADKCVFNSLNIGARKKYLSENPIPKRNILFWRDEDQKIRWRDAGKNDFYWAFTYLVSTEKSNKFLSDGRTRTPANADDFNITVDSYSNSQGGRKYGSKASAWIGRKADLMDPDNTGKVVGHLYGRPQAKDTLHEQVMMCAEFFGAMVWYEHTADDYFSYFRDRGKIGYLGRYPISLIDPIKRSDAERHRGTPITPFSLTKQLDNGIAYVENHCDKIDFIELLDNLLIFDPYDRTAYDTVVSWLMNISVLMQSSNKSHRRTSPLVETVVQSA